MTVTHFLVKEVLVAGATFFRTSSSLWLPTPSSTRVSHSSFDRKYSSIVSMTSPTALWESNLSACSSQQNAELVYRALVHQWLNDVGKQSRDVMLPDLGLVAGDFQSHPNLNIPELSHEFVLLRVLTQPSDKESSEKVGRGDLGYGLLRKGYHIGTGVTGIPIHT